MTISFGNSSVDRDVVPSSPGAKDAENRTVDPAQGEGMAEYEPSQYSRRKIVNAGKALRGTLTVADADALEVFRIAHSWRRSHLLPMHRVRQDLGVRARRAQPLVLTAARLKRMASIRRKLRDTPLSLYQIQDIAGCRAVLDSVEMVNALADDYRHNGRFNIVREDDYIRAPKHDGYRSHHIILKFNAPGVDERFSRHFVEVQLRTKLQHAWATAVEAVGLVRGENLKAGEGNPEWLKFFKIMSAEFAAEEGQAPVPGVEEDRTARRAELRKIERLLGAVERLESYRHVIRFADEHYSGNSKQFIILYNYDENRVEVRPNFTYFSDPDKYIGEEAVSSTNIVFVEVDRVEDLKAAFPNYFLDVDIFVRRLRAILNDRDPQDLSWVREWTGPLRAPE